MNVHGKKSGYILARPAEEITLFDIYQAFEPPFHLVDCLAPNYLCAKEKVCSAKHFWQGLNKVIIDYFKSFTLDRKSTRLNSSHVRISYAVFCLKKKTNITCHPSNV